MGSKAHKEKIWNYISKIRTGMLVSEDAGSMRARPMQLVQDNYDGTLWFFNRLDSHKSQEIAQDRNVCVTFCDQENGIYVSLSGKASINRDQSLIDSLWTQDTESWFSEGKEDKHCSLLEIKVVSGEHWDHETNDLIKIFKKAKSNIENKKPNLSENEKFGDTH